MATFTGTNGNDTITPALITAGVTINPPGSDLDDAADTLFGNGGQDLLDGGAGDDTLNGGNGDDILSDADDASDTLNGGNDDDTLRIFDTAEVANGNAGNDRFELFAFVGTQAASGILNGGSGTDTLDPQGVLSLAGVINGIENLALDTSELSLGTPQLNFFTTLVADSGPTGKIRINGDTPAAVAVAASLTTLQVTGSVGANTLTFNASAATAVLVDADAGNDVIQGGAGDDELAGGDGNDVLRGMGGDDLLDGELDADTIEGGAGNDIMDGGEGNSGIFVFDPADTASYASATSAVSVSLSLQGLNQNTGGAGTDNLTNFENLTGSAFSDLLIGDANINTLTGAAGNDTLTGSGGNDVLNGGTGNDTLNGGTGVDIATYASAGGAVTVSLALQGAAQATNAGLDTLLGIESLTGSAFNDTLTGDGADNTLRGDNGNDTLGGAGGDDVLFGGNGNDTLTGGPGIDTLNGGAGNDTLTGIALDIASYAGATGPVTVSLALAGAQNTLGAGTDTITGCIDLVGSSFGDTLIGNGNSNEIRGGLGDDDIFGNGLNDVLFGELGNDRLEGGDGNDFLEAGPGNDVMLGQVGNDTYSFRPGAGTDQILFAPGIDTLRFEGFGPDFDTAAEIIATATLGPFDVILTLDNPNSLTDTVIELGPFLSIADLDPADFIVIA